MLTESFTCRDVIDTTPADGNVYKMLLGSVNDWFHGDRDEDTDKDDEPSEAGLAFANLTIRR